MEPRGPTDARDPDAGLLERMRAGDEAAFATIVRRYHAPLLRLARLRVADDATAEDVVQETWLAVLDGLDRFEGRSTFRTWLFRIADHRAVSRGRREARTVPLGTILRAGESDEEPTVAADRFIAEGRAWAGHWAIPPEAWAPGAEERLLGSEMLAVLAEAIGRLPPAQQLVVTLRDLEGWPSDDVCAALEISPGNQRVLLHRGRAHLRAELDRYLRPPRNERGTP